MDFNRQETLEKIGRYCAYQDRCHAEVRKKLHDMETPWDEVDDIMVRLIEDGFLDEERYARSYVRGKFNQKRWGRVKIRQGLRSKEIGERLVELALNGEIEEEEYLQAATEVGLKKYEQLWDAEDDFVRERKTEQYLYSRGYEWDVIRTVMMDIPGMVDEV